MDLMAVVFGGLTVLIMVFLAMIVLQCIRVEKTIETLVELAEREVTRFYREGEG